MYTRKTQDVWELQGHYGYGWEMVTTEESRQEAKKNLKLYNENERYPHRIIKKRVRVEA